MALLGNIFGGRTQRGGMSAINMALLGVLAYRTLKGKGRLADMLGRNSDASSPPAPGNSSGLGGLLGGLGGMGALGSIFGTQGTGSAITDGLRHLMDRFQKNGHGEKVQSWVAAGPNKSIAPNELEQALGPERMEWLIQETGMTKAQLLDGLSKQLPQTVDQLTPQGRLPKPDEI